MQWKDTGRQVDTERGRGGKGMDMGKAVKSTNDEVRSVRAASACLAGPAW